MSLPHSPPDWPHYQWFRLVRRGLSLAAEVPASQPDRRAWVKVWPYGEENHYLVQYFEVENAHYQEAYGSYDCDHFLLNEQRYMCEGVTEVKRLLDQWLNDLTKLRDPGTTTYPA